MRRFAQRWWLVASVLVVAVLAVSWALYRGELDHRHDEQVAAERQAYLVLGESVDDVLGRERALGGVIAAQNGPIGDSWPALANVVTGQPVANAAAFIEPVSERDRAAFERRTGVRMLESPRPGVVRSAGHRPLHLVVTHVWRKSPGGPSLGMDLAANALRRRLLLAAARTGRQTATPPVEFLGRPAHRYGVAVSVPVRDRAGHLKGWVVASYRAQQLAAMVTSHLPGAKLTIKDGSAVLLSGAQPTGGRPATLHVAGRRWHIWATVAGGTDADVPWLVLGFGLCLALAVSLNLRQARTREQHATGALAEREAEEIAVQRIATLVAEQGTPEDVFALVAAQVGKLLDSRTAAVSRFEPDRNRGVIVGNWTPTGEDLTGSEFALDGVTASAGVFRTGRTAVTAASYQSATDPIAPLMGTIASSGGIAAPIIVGGQVWGALGAAYNDRAVPADAEARLARFARLIGLAISNADAWERLARQASTDPLTGMANRRAFDERLRTELARARRHERTVGLVLFDLDHFKQINDERGHRAGDQVLIRVARLLSDTAREGELVARIGGEEFAWLMPDTDGAGAHAAAERARDALERECFPGLRTVTLSAGVTISAATDTPDSLLDGADKALYRAKQAGRNAVCVHRGQAPSPDIVPAITLAPAP